MKWRKFQETDYALMKEWFVEHGWDQPPVMEILPPTGFLVESDKGVPMAAGFLYLTNAPSVAWVEWLVTDPKLGIVGFGALKYLIEVVQKSVKLLGVKTLIHLCKPKYVNVFEKKLGFKSTEDARIMILGVE